MLGYTLKKRLNKRKLKSIYYFYYKYINNLVFIPKITEKFIHSFFLYLPTRQHNVHIKDLKKQKVFSSGLVIKQNKTNLKFYKRTLKVNSSLILHLQKLYGDFIKFISLLYIKNFNLRNWIFLQKYMVLLNPTFHLIIFKKSYNTNLSSVRRIKRRVLRNFKK